MTGPQITPEQLAQAQALYKTYREQQVAGKMDDAQMNQPSDHSTMGDFGRGLATGGAQSVSGTVGMVGKLLTTAGASSVGPAVTRFADDAGHEAQDFYDPRGTAGRIGRGTGEAVGNAAQFMAGGEAMGGEKLAAKVAGKAFIGGGAGTAAATALPASLVDAGAHALTGQPGETGFWGRLGQDEAGAAAFGGLGSLVGRVGGAIGKIGGRLLGNSAGEAAPAEAAGARAVVDAAHPGTAAPAPDAPPAAALSPTADPNLHGGEGDPMMAGSQPSKATTDARTPVERGGDRPQLEPYEEEMIKKYRMGKNFADAAGHAEGARSMQEGIDEVITNAKARTNPSDATPAPANMDAKAPAPQESAPKESPTLPAKGAAEPTEAPKATDAQAPSEQSKPAVAKSKGSQKGGPARATPVESNSGTGAQGAPKASKPAPATKPAASPTDAPAAKPGKAKPVRKANPTATGKSDTESWLKTARDLYDRTGDGPAKVKLAAQIAAAEKELGG